MLNVAGVLAPHGVTARDMAEKPLTESDICGQFITPAIHDAGWDRVTQIRREYSFTAGAGGSLALGNLPDR